MPEFRKAAADDLPAIIDIIRQARAFIRTLGIDQWQHYYPKKALLQNDIALGRAWVYDDGTSPVAVAVIIFDAEPCYEVLDTAGISGGTGWLADGMDYATLHRFAVNDIYRHSGLAARLLGKAEAVSRAGGACSLRTDTHRGNIPMRRLLEKNGYILCGEVEYAIPKGDRIRVAYEKVLRHKTDIL